MKQFYKILNLLSLVLMLVFSIDSFSQGTAEINTNNQTICLNQNIYIEFQVDNGNNNDPYTFTYNINGGPSSTISSPVGSRRAFLLFSSNSTGTFVINLLSATNANNNTLNINNNQRTITVTNNNAPPTISGNLSICDVTGNNGNTSQLQVSPNSPGSSWSTSNSNVADVNNSGLVTGATGNNSQTGTTIITYNNNNGCDNSVLFTVNPLPTITPNTNSICVGSTLNLNGSGTPATTNPWTSSNTTVATVDNTGLVTGVAPGSVTITYKDINGCTATRNITVIAGSAANFTYTNGFLCSGSSVSFNTTSTGNSYTWNFGDNNSSSQQNPSHTFNSLGCGAVTYNVSLTVNGNNGCPSTITKIVTIQQQPDVNFVDLNPDATEPFSNCGIASVDNQNFDINVGLSSTSSNCQTYSINWGDSQITNNATFPAFHSYNSLGTYTMSITSVGINGCSVVKTFIIKNSSNPSGGFGSPGNTTGLCVPTNSLNFSITASSYDSLTGNLISPGWDKNSPDTTYLIDWGDGTTTGPLLQSNLIQTVFFNNNINGTSSNYPISHTYTTVSCPSAYTATLTVTNSCGFTDFTLNNISTISKPIASFTAPTASCINSNVLFTNTSTLGFSANCSRGTRYSWDFGDPSSGASNIIPFPTGAGSLQPTTPNANHVFSGPGYYTVTLTANSGGTPGCGNSIFTQNICIESQLNPQFTLSGTVFCSPGIVQVNNTTSFINPCNPTYQWNVIYAAGYCGSGTPTWSYTNGTSSASANPSFSFETPGTYSITLTATNSCGSVTSPIQTVIVKQPPTVAISSIPDICLGATVTPTISVNSCSNLALPTSPPAYSWTATGATPSTSNATTPPTFSYANTGTYTIGLSVTNECGTTPAVSNSFIVKPNNTVGAASSTPTLCINTALSPNITHTTTGATGIGTAIGLPNGVTTSWAGNTITISGIPTVSGTFNYSIPLTGGCGSFNATGTIIVTPSNTVTSGITTNLCINTTLSPNITHTTTGATGIGTPTGLPAGVSAAWSGNTITISGTPTASGTFAYSIPLTGGCGSVNATGTIIVNPLNTVTPGTTRTLCLNVTLSPNITHRYNWMMLA